MTDDMDLSWRPVAEASRSAMALLGKRTPPCLPHEAEWCGGGYAAHAVAHLAVLKAVADHHLEHAGLTELADDVYAATATELADAESSP